MFQELFDLEEFLPFNFSLLLLHPGDVFPRCGALSEPRGLHATLHRPEAPGGAVHPRAGGRRDVRLALRQAVPQSSAENA